ncbi:Endonuclease V family protein [Trichomonas vaginalis G3]|uniref:Endonuclease V family protein n=1 Tax=Trichomonas vaginalis (strain ATCC PRA-98 / G3) TaxID=412133 RepID=A2EHP1_TRIV3|nr:endoribonuclease activity, producing 5'-phosphomonoesters family [Trichomonas vaginalis G3]EAY07837.1 Endonuclease V family protein [Trichomonas vaginalis G3]KAI5553449.1 endoribonuclease activity, producing 5'-phosphomonoesters family [Trichomonas vaginalis G3]|eukprot:XP_001320060.1 Endonuclease V family protein [Trichomonas vaginalis G3]
MDIEETKAKLRELQTEMVVQIDNTKHLDNVRYVAGADLTVEDDLMVGCLVVIDMENIDTPVYSKCTVVNVDVPYIPGLLCFREGPVVLQMLDEFNQANTGIKIDLIIVDGNGEWHTRGLGLASYVGLKSNIPACGVSKTFFYVGEGCPQPKDVQKMAQDKCPEKGDYYVLDYTTSNDRYIKCAVMRTTDSHPFNPIYVSSGHLCDLDSVVSVIKKLCRFREPEPTRLADRISREFVRENKHKK